MNSNKKKILLVGLGSEIGSSLISLNCQFYKKFKIDSVLTNPIFGDDIFKNLLSLKARLVINDPQLTDKIRINSKNCSLTINKNEIKIYFGDFKNFNLKKFPKKFFVTIVATSKKHISKKLLMQRYSRISNYVLGVAESKSIPSLYPNLMDINSKIIQKNPIKIDKFEKKVFALGSCQSNGWQAQLRALMDSFNSLNINDYKILGCELDIVHPDTPQGKLGTKSIDPRDQDARNNLRPGFSQASDSMKKLFKSKHLINTISLRTLISPPGYQICRFFLSTPKEKKININDLMKTIKKNSSKKKTIYQISEIPLGSRAFEQSNTAATILLNEKYFHLNYLKFINHNKNEFIEIIFQSYVHNTRGYCVSVFETIKKLANSKKNYFCYQ